MGISEQSTLLCEQKLLTSRQIFRYAVPARTVTKKHWCRHSSASHSSSIFGQKYSDSPKIARDLHSSLHRLRIVTQLKLFCCAGIALELSIPISPFPCNRVTIPFPFPNYTVSIHISLAYHMSICHK